MVTPISAIDHGSDGTCGGPIWPDWDNRDVERHCRNGKPVDRRPAEALTDETCDIDNAFWCGFVDQHFGHQIADFMMRVIPTEPPGN